MAQIGEDAVRPLYEHLLALPEGDALPKRIDRIELQRGAGRHLFEARGEACFALATLSGHCRFCADQAE
jgi:hypothetical protein